MPPVRRWKRGFAPTAGSALAGKQDTAGEAGKGRGICGSKLMAPEEHYVGLPNRGRETRKAGGDVHAPRKRVAGI